MEEGDTGLRVKSQKKNKFTPEEDCQLRILVEQFGATKWYHIGRLMKNRSGRQCRERWSNYLRPNIKSSEWTEQEDKFIIDKYLEMGPKWRFIATLMDGRAEIAVKNRFKSLKRRTVLGKKPSPMQPVLIKESSPVKIEVPIQSDDRMYKKIPEKVEHPTTTDEIVQSLFNFESDVEELF